MSADMAYLLGVATPLSIGLVFALVALRQAKRDDR